ncbi:Alpha/Beta hydrolase protein, partial [Trichophaea hybrida]
LHLPPPSSCRSKTPLYISIHGGSLTYGTPKKDTLFCRTITHKLSCITASISYRKSPRHTYPSHVHDVAHLIEAILSDPEYAGVIDTENIVLGGFSAGAMIALSLIQHPEWRGGFLGVVAWYPKVDGTLVFSDEQCVGVDRGKVDVRMKEFLAAINWGCGRGVRLDDPMMSPGFMGIELVPERMLICAGREDMFCSESERFVERV